MTAVLLDAALRLPFVMFIAYLQLATSICAIVTSSIDPGIIPARKQKMKMRDYDPKSEYYTPS